VGGGLVAECLSGGHLSIDLLARGSSLNLPDNAFCQVLADPQLAPLRLNRFSSPFRSKIFIFRLPIKKKKNMLRIVYLCNNSPINLK